MANSVGGKKASRRAKDAAMAADLKARGVTREVQRCPICYRVMPIGGRYHQHVSAGCK